MAGKRPGRHETADVGQMDVSGEDIHFRGVAAYSADRAEKGRVRGSKMMYILWKEGTCYDYTKNDDQTYGQFYIFPVAGNEFNTLINQYPDRHPPKYNDYT